MALAENLSLYGRKVIYISDSITRDNVIDVVSECLKTHQRNVAQMSYLYDYYRGKQDILQRTKEFNEYILNKVTENRAKEIVDFKTAYLVGEPIKYSANDEEYADEVDELNDFCRLEGKETLDYDLIEWMNITGTAYRLILPKHKNDGSPFILATPSPMNTFVAYSTRITHEPVLCCYVTKHKNITTYSVYAKQDNGNMFYEITDRKITAEQEWTLSELPIIEYPHGKSRIGAFESVISLLNAINTLDSNRLDSIEQFVQSLLVLINCKLPEGVTASTIKEMGLIELISNEQNRAEIQQIVNTLDQTNTQTLKEDMLQAVRTIVSMPNVSATNTSGDNGLAVVYRNGWEGAYESALTDQKAIDRSEFMALKLMLEICEKTNTLSAPLKALNIDYTRQHYENMATKSQVLISMLNSPLIHPKDSFEVCGLFYDPNKKYMNGQEWYKQNQGTQETDETSITETPTVEI